MRSMVCELVGIDAPLFGLSRSPGVVAAISNAGGLGVLSATSYQPDELDLQLCWIDKHVRGRPYGVDLLVPPGGGVEPAELRRQIPQRHLAFVAELLDRYGIPAPDPSVRSGHGLAANIEPAGIQVLLDVAHAHPISLVASALGPPPPTMVDRAKAKGVAVAALVGSPRHVRRQVDSGVDIIVAQGTEAGGHTGGIATMVLTPEVVDIAGSVPVLAAGGIASGRQMAAALALGAAGVWLGSVWLSSHEDVTSGAIKTKLLKATSDDTIVSRTRTGKPARQLHSAWHDEWAKPESPATLTMSLQSELVGEAWERIDAAAKEGNEGAIALESFFVGQVVGGFERLRPAGEIARRIIDDCAARLGELRSLDTGWIPGGRSGGS